MLEAARRACDDLIRLAEEARRQGPASQLRPLLADPPTSDEIAEMGATLCTMLDIILTYWDQVIMSDTEKRRVRSVLGARLRDILKSTDRTADPTLVGFVAERITSPDRMH
jgi:hypothetical protein